MALRSAARASSTMTTDGRTEDRVVKTRSGCRLLRRSGVVTAVACVLVAAFLIGPRLRKESPLDQAWSIVEDQYFDRSFARLDWGGVHRTFQQRASTSSVEGAGLYWSTINPMLRLLESSHTYAVAPHSRRATSLWSKAAATMEVLEPSLGRCFGLWTSTGRKNVSTKVLSVDPEGIGYGLGIRPGWRFVDKPPAPANSRTSASLAFLDTVGNHHDLRIGAPYIRAYAGTKFSAQLGRDLLAIDSRRLRRAQAKEMTMPSLGLTVSPGAVATPFVVALVDDDSVAARAGIVEGATVISLHDGSDKDGLLRASGSFQNPDGSVRRLYGRLECDDVKSTVPQVRFAASDGITYLRFDKFEAGLVKHLIKLGMPTRRPLIIDLRWNTGGSVDEMKLLLEKLIGAPVNVDSRVRLRRPRLSSNEQPRRIAILLSPISASAAEVTADALRRYAGAKIVGRRSSGEVEVSRRYSLDDGGSVQVAVHAFFSTTGEVLEGVGVVPDHLIEADVSSGKPHEDATMRAASRILRGH